MCFVKTYSCVVSFVFWPLDWPIGQNVILDQLISWFDQLIPLCLVCHQFSENIFYILHLTFDIWHLTLKWHDMTLLDYIGTIPAHFHWRHLNHLKIYSQSVSENYIYLRGASTSDNNSEVQQKMFVCTLILFHKVLFYSVQNFILYDVLQWDWYSNR